MYVWDYKCGEERRVSARTKAGSLHCEMVQRALTISDFSCQVSGLEQPFEQPGRSGKLQATSCKGTAKKPLLAPGFSLLAEQPVVGVLCGFEPYPCLFHWKG